MTRAEIVALVARCQTAFDRLDADLIAAEHSDSCVMESPTAGGTVVGRAGILKVYDLWFQGFPDLVATQEELLIDGSRFSQSYTLTGTDTGGFLGLPPTGKPFRVPMVWVCEVVDGKIARSRPIYDYSGVLIQIGVLKAKPAKLS
ncbi:MAG TPA: ester cyclase [Vicinamibacterales bacterium]|nr:ester cyclase [Vicinamibacterales bacterium]